MAAICASLIRLTVPRLSGGTGFLIEKLELPGESCPASAGVIEDSFAERLGRFQAGPVALQLARHRNPGDRNAAGHDQAADRHHMRCRAHRRPKRR